MLMNPWEIWESSKDFKIGMLFCSTEEVMSFTFVSSLPHALKIRGPQNDLILIQVWEEALP